MLHSLEMLYNFSQMFSKRKEILNMIRIIQENVTFRYQSIIQFLNTPLYINKTIEFVKCIKNSF